MYKYTLSTRVKALSISILFLLLKIGENSSVQSIFLPQFYRWLTVKQSQGILQPTVFSRL